MATKGEMKEKLGKGMNAYFSGMTSKQPSATTEESSLITDHPAQTKNESSVITEESSTKDKISRISNEGSKENDHPSVITKDTSNIKNESSRIIGESSVMTEDHSLKNEVPPVINDESPLAAKESSMMSEDQSQITIDRDALSIAIMEAKKNPRVPLWSEMSKTLLLYNQLIRDKRLVRPKVSLSEEGSDILDEAIRKAFPEMCRVIEGELKKNS